MKKLLIFLGLIATLSFGETFQDGANAYNNKDYKTAFTIFEDLANKGDANAQYNIGAMYEYGKGISKDDKKAFEWYEKSAKQGNPTAQYIIGTRYYLKQDNKKAFEWFEKSATQGNAYSQHMLGRMYSNGYGTKQDTIKAKLWLKKACDGGLQRGCDDYKKLN